MTGARGAWACLAIVSLVTGGQARAASPSQDPAEVMFQRGLADMLTGQYASGCPAIAESLRLDPRPGTLFTLAECESRAGLVASALGHYEEFLHLVSQMPPDAARRQHERGRIAIDQKARLAELTPTLIITVASGAPPGTRVERDGVPLNMASVGAPVRVDPGEHRIAISVPGGRPIERRIALQPGEHRDLPIGLADLVPLVVAAAPPTPAMAARGDLDRRRARRRRWGATLATAGAALAVVGGAGLLIAKGKVDAIDRARATGHPFDEATGNYRTYEVGGAISLAAGATSLISGVTLYVSAAASAGSDRSMTALVGGSF